jgi:hypothetical protein
MLLDDPIAMYLDEGGKITPGFRLRAPIPQEVPPPDIGVPDIPLFAQAEDLPSRNRDRFTQAPNSNAGEVDSVRETMEQRHSDPIYGGNVDSLINDPIYSTGNMDAYLNDPIYGGQGYGGAYTMYDDIPGLDVGDVPSFGNTEYIGA